MTGLIIPPLRLAALDRMKVLRVPVLPPPHPVLLNTAELILKNVKLPYAPGDYFVREAWCCEVDPLTSKTTGKILYKADGQEVMLDDGDGSWAENKNGTFASPWRSPMHMKEEDSRYIVTLGPPVPCRLGEVTEFFDEGVERSKRTPGWAVMRDLMGDKIIVIPSYAYINQWDAIYPRHPYSPERWTWGYPMTWRLK